MKMIRHEQQKTDEPLGLALTVSDRIEYLCRDGRTAEVIFSACHAADCDKIERTRSNPRWYVMGKALPVGKGFSFRTAITHALDETLQIARLFPTISTRAGRAGRPSLPSDLQMSCALQE
jgi:hypothetical protein